MGTTQHWSRLCWPGIVQIAERAPWQRKMRPKSAEKVIKPANGSLTLRRHPQVIRPWSLCDMPAPYRSVCRVPLQNADGLSFWDFLRFIVRRILHSLSGFGRVGFS